MLLHTPNLGRWLLLLHCCLPHFCSWPFSLHQQEKKQACEGDKADSPAKPARNVTLRSRCDGHIALSTSSSTSNSYPKIPQPFYGDLRCAQHPASTARIPATTGTPCAWLYPLR